MSKDAEVAAAQARLGRFLQKIDGLEADDNTGLVELLRAKTAKGWNALMIAARYEGDRVARVLAATEGLSGKEKQAVLVDMLSAVNSGGGSALLFAAEFSPSVLKLLLVTIAQLREPHTSEILRKLLLAKVDGRKNAMQRLAHTDPAKAKNLLLDLRRVNLLVKAIAILESSFASILKQLEMSGASRAHLTAVHKLLTRDLALSVAERAALAGWLNSDAAPAEKLTLLLVKPQFVVKVSLMAVIVPVEAQRRTLRLLKLLLSSSQCASVDRCDDEFSEGGKSFAELVAWIRDSQMVPQRHRPIVKTILAGYRKQLKEIDKSPAREASC